MSLVTSSQEPDLEGRLVLIAGDSKVSRAFRDDLFSNLREDHQYGTRVVRLDSDLIHYSNAELNFRLSSPDAGLSMKKIEHLLRTGDSYFVSKLEDPSLEDPLGIYLDELFHDLGGKYAQLAGTSGLNPEVRRQRFFSFAATRFGKILRNVLDEELLERRLWDITDSLYTFCEASQVPLMKKYLSSEVSDQDKVALNMLRLALRGYLNDVVLRRPKNFALEELKSISCRIGTDIIQPGDHGRLSWIIPFLDLRSDHNNGDPHEGIRVKELAKHAKMYGVERITMLRGHSQRGIDFFTNLGIKVDNLTQTNEYISMLVQLIDDFGRCYVLSPDKGGLADAMVFARELYRRTDGRFSGRVIELAKTRTGIGEIGGMTFSTSYLYDPKLERKEDQKKDSTGNLIPYDHVLTHSVDYKDRESPNYIGRLFGAEFSAEQKEQLDAQVHGHHSLTRDDLIASGGTIINAAGYVSAQFGSKTTAMIEHPSFTGNAIKKLGQAYADGYLAAVFTSNSIVHPHKSDRPWHVERSLSRRFAAGIKREYREFICDHFPDFNTRLKELDVRSL